MNTSPRAPSNYAVGIDFGTESGRAVKSVDVIPKRSREGDVRPCELESEGSLIRIFSRRYVVDYDAEVRGRVERARTRWRRNRAKWRKRQTQKAQTPDISAG